MAQFAELHRKIYMINYQRLVNLLTACVEKKQLPVNIDVQCAAIVIRATITGLNAIRYVGTMVSIMKYSPFNKKQFKCFII